MKILITGANGMLGTKLESVFCDYNVIGFDKSQLDITDLNAVMEAVSLHNPDIIINSAAYTKVDDCEVNAGRAFLANAEGPKNLALACKDKGVKLVQISTDYVFDGTKTSPYKEDDRTNPMSVYGRSKLSGEENIKALLQDYIIIRTQWLYGENGPNFVETMLRIANEKDELRVVNDQRGSPTYTKDLSLSIKALIDKGCEGIYHAANSGSCTWYEFAVEILRAAGLDKRVMPITTKEIARPAKRPANSVLSSDKLERDTGGFAFRPWQEALNEYMMGKVKRQ